MLESIRAPEDIRTFNREQLECLCAEIRSFLIQSVSKTGGHLASNLGIVELTVALHREYDVYRDRLVFDVGHQSYVHKLLTGRMAQFQTLRRFGGLAGFPKPSESDADAFIAGHASNSISVALGMARSRTLMKQSYQVVCLIGDGALTGGLSYEALNDAGQSGEPMVVILNDNGMSIGSNVGGIAKLLAHERVKPAYYSFKKAYRKFMSKIPGGRHIYRATHNLKTAIKQAILHCSLFEEMGFTYFGPVDGHNLDHLSYFIHLAKESGGPALVHVVTKKGKGYPPAEADPDTYHGVPPFSPEHGLVPSYKPTFSTEFGRALVRLAREDMRICAITAAMEMGTGLTEFAKEFQHRFFDVGIAESHAVSMAAGMAKQGMVPVFAVYSSFLQRSYDMLIHDVAISGLHVVLCVDRAGLVGEDGETHHGVFDVAFLCQIPGMTVYAPSSFAELESLLELAVHQDGPVALRYPRGGEGEYREDHGPRTVMLQHGDALTLVSYGTMLNQAIEAARRLQARGYSCTLIKLGTLAPLNLDLVLDSVRQTGRLVVLEDCIAAGSVGARIVERLAQIQDLPFRCLLKNLGNAFTTHGSVPQLLAALRLDGASVAADIENDLFGVQP